MIDKISYFNYLRVLIVLYEYVLMVLNIMRFDFINENNKNNIN